MSAEQRSYTGRILATAAIYIAAAWAGAEALLTVVDRFGLPAWWGTLVTALFVAGLPVTVFLVWRAAGVERRAGMASILGSLVFLAAATGGIFWFTRPEPPAPPRVVAVMPCEFEGAGTYAYRAEGLAEDIHARLSRVDAVKLLSWNSSLYAREKGFLPRQIAEVLHADRLVLCRMRVTPERIGLTASVVDPTAEAVLWDRRYDFLAEDLGMVVTEVAGSLLDVLGTKALASELDRVHDLGTFSAEAYDLLLQARAEGDRDHAEALLRRALEIDPAYAQALVQLSQLFLERTMSQEFNDTTQLYGWILESRDLARQSLELDSGVYDARSNLATICMLLGTYYNEPCPPGEAERLRHEECEVKGDTAAGWACRSFELEDDAESLAALERWLELEPTSWEANGQLIWHYWLSEGRQGEALAVFDTLRALYPEDTRTYGFISNLLRREGRFDEVLAWRFAAWNDQLPEGPWQLARLGTDYLNLGLYEQALDIGLRTWETRRASAVHFLPHLWVEHGEPERAVDVMAWLGRILDETGSARGRLTQAAFLATTLRAYEEARGIYDGMLADATLPQLCENQEEDCTVFHALVLAHVEKVLGDPQRAAQWLAVAEQNAAQLETGASWEVLLNIGRGRLDEAVRQLRERVLTWHVDGNYLVFSLLWLEQDALFDPLRGLPAYQHLLEDYRAHLEPQRQRVLMAESNGDWEPLRQRVYQRARGMEG